MSENMKAEVFSEEDEFVSHYEEESTEQVGNSSNSLCEALHGGRPADEEPHIKKTMKRGGVKIDLILRVGMVWTWVLSILVLHWVLLLKPLGISEDDFEDLHSLFQVKNCSRNENNT